MSKSKQQMLMVIGVAILVIGLVWITYSFFNYTRTGIANRISVGRISFVTDQTDTINLTNVFPIDSSDVDTDTDNVDEVVIQITGDTDYSEGVEYLISSVNSSFIVNDKVLPISLDIKVVDLGTSNDNYFTARESTNTSIYKQLVGDTLEGNQPILVGYIKPNTTSGTIEGVGWNSTGTSTYYLYTNDDNWSLSPCDFGPYGALAFSSSRGLSSSGVGNTGGLRPVVSLRLGTEFDTGGDGTPTNPYVVKYD